MDNLQNRIKKVSGKPKINPKIETILNDLYWQVMIDYKDLQDRKIIAEALISQLHDFDYSDYT